MFTASDLSTHFEGLLSTLKGPDLVRARTAAENFSRQLRENSYLDVRAVVTAANTLQNMGPRFTRSPLTNIGFSPPRDEAFDQAMDVFVEAVRQALLTRESFERDVAANANLTRGECRERVHKYLATQRDQVSSVAVIAGTCLSLEQVNDAIEQLEYEGLLASDMLKSNFTNSGCVWNIRLNPLGRSLLDGTKPARPAPSYGPVTTITGSTFHNSPVSVTGMGNITATVKIPLIPPDLREVIDADTTAALQLRALEAETAKTAPRANIVGQLYSGLRTTIESLNLSAEVAEHSHVWLAALHSAIGHLT